MVCPKHNKILQVKLMPDGKTEYAICPSYDECHYMHTLKRRVKTDKRYPKTDKNMPVWSN